MTALMGKTYDPDLQEESEGFDDALGLEDPGSPLPQAGSQAPTGSSLARVQRADGRAGWEPAALASVDPSSGTSPGSETHD